MIIFEYTYCIKNYSVYYIKNSACTCRQFLEFINIKNKKENDVKFFKKEDLRTITKEDVYSFIYFLCDHGIKIASVYTKINQLRAFFKYLYNSNNYLFLNPTSDLKDLNFKKYKNEYLPKVLSLEECKMLLNPKLYNISSIYDIRDYAILTFFLNTGVRLSELTNLKISNIDFLDKSARIFGKGRKERIIYLNKAVVSSLDNYLKAKEKSRD